MGGVLKPVGFFDPLGLSKGIDEEKFIRWRTIEIKHGRICMMAFLGFIWQQGVGHLPGYISHSPDLKFSDIPDGVAAIAAASLSLACSASRPSAPRAPSTSTALGVRNWAVT